MKKLDIRHSTVMKTIAFLLVIFMAWTCVACAVGIVIMFDEEVYTKSESTIRYDAFKESMGGKAYWLIFNLLSEQLVADDFEEVNYTYEIFRDGVRIDGDCDDPTAYSEEWTFEYLYTKETFEYTAVDGESVEDPFDMGDSEYAVRMYVNPHLPFTDELSAISQAVHILYSLRFVVYIILASAALLVLACFIYLMLASGHRAGIEGVSGGGLTCVPFDVVTVIVAFLALFSLFCVAEFTYGTEETVITIAVIGTFDLVVALAYFMTIAARIKLGNGDLWRNTVICRLIKLTCKLICAIPVVWKTSLACAAVGFLSLMFLVINPFGIARFVLWFIGCSVLFPSLIYIATVLRRLIKATDALARGDLSHQTDTAFMFGDMKRAGDNLNNIAQGMTVAVEQRMKSERLKTELITNVSHDIKTPLTTIINYSDLICREQIDNLNVKEYSEELHRQSERLKKLIEDLIEASKASTGNIEAHPSPCEIGVMLAQTAGEYKQRLEDHGLTLVVHSPEEPLTIMADGRLLWRVLDNLLSNACKYSQKGTRVYLTLSHDGNDAVIAVKNTSEYELNVDADELIERFVRGDRSRSTQGSGLGLSIARSLTELQGGKMQLTVDGDLFKVILRFPLCDN